MNDELHALALAASPAVEPAELHGTVCGMAAGNPTEFQLGALVDLLGTDMLNDETSVQNFVAASLDDYFSQDMEFNPLIPDDENALGERLVGLASWCAGFLSGFGAGCQTPFKELADELQELIRDFVSISGLSEDEVENEQNEASFMEVFEYVRVGAVLALAIMAEDAGDAEEEPDTLH